MGNSLNGKGVILRNVLILAGQGITAYQAGAVIRPSRASMTAVGCGRWSMSIGHQGTLAELQTCVLGGRCNSVSRRSCAWHERQFIGRSGRWQFHDEVISASDLGVR